jgi:hypothetical protein
MQQPMTYAVKTAALPAELSRPPHNIGAHIAGADNPASTTLYLIRVRRGRPGDGCGPPSSPLSSGPRFE